MKPEDRERVKEILDQALELAPEERMAYVEATCGDAPEVAREVVELLAMDDESIAILERPALEQSGFAEDIRRATEAPRYAAGDKIGIYKIVGELGHGGMGTVYLAEHEEYRKQVALKVMSQPLASPEEIRRFDLEAQLLSGLEHPYIASFYDGGTTKDGRPYFVMEPVLEAEPLDKRCAELPVRARLELFLKVCEAVRYAHQRLIVHRDLKPSNILITADGAPKLLDFGIAKELDPVAIEETAHWDQRLTWPYASPEQAARIGAPDLSKAPPITTASDVYSLGVVLYQILAGQRPYKPSEDNLHGWMEVIRDTEPPPPSRRVAEADAESTRAVRREITGDLDSIVLKALAKSLDVRYGSVEELIADLQRYLDGKPVLAHQGTWWYQAGKLAKRHRLAVAAFCALVVFAITVTMLLRQAVVAETRTRYAFDAIKEIVWVPALLNDRENAEKILENGRSAAENLREEPELFAEILQPLARLAKGLERCDLALQFSREAVEVMRRLEVSRQDMGRTLNNYATTLAECGFPQEAIPLHYEALGIKETLPDSDPAKNYGNLGSAYFAAGRLAQAEEFYLKSLELREKAAEPDPTNIAMSLRNLGNVESYLGNREAEDRLRRALEIREAAGDLPINLTRVLIPLGRALQSQGRLVEAEEMFRRALKISSAEDLSLPVNAEKVAKAKRGLAWVLIDLGGLAEAEELLDSVLEFFPSASPGKLDWEHSLTQMVLGNLRQDQGRTEEARELLRKSLDELQEMRGETIYTRQTRGRLLRIEQSDS